MRKSALLCLALLLPAGGASAALSGFHDSAEQINTLFQSQEIDAALHGLPVDKVERKGAREDGTIRWEIESRDCELDVWLKPVPPQGPGKTTYEIARISACD